MTTIYDVVIERITIITVIVMTTVRMTQNMKKPPKTNSDHQSVIHKLN